MMRTLGAAAATEPPIGEPTAYVAPDAQRICVGGRPLLFSRSRQQLFQLNDTADRIWQGLAAGGSEAVVAADLAAAGLEPDAARAYVAEAARTWMLAGLIVPDSVAAAPLGAAGSRRVLRLDEMAVELALHGLEPGPLDAAFGHLQGPATTPLRRVDAVGHGDLAFLFLDGRLLTTTELGGLAAQVKAALTELYVEGVEGAFLAHGALLAREGFSLFLSGRPGAGKTTLTLALAAAGWAYASDDIVRIGPDGLATGAPFAAAVKTGAWALLQDRWPQVGALPTWRRADGQDVRYLLPGKLAARTPRPLDAVLLLDRRERAAAELQPVEPVEALSEILESAYSARWRLDAPALSALAARLEAARCRRLVYSDLDDAVSLIGSLAPCPA